MTILRKKIKYRIGEEGYMRGRGDDTDTVSYFRITEVSPVALMEECVASVSVNKLTLFMSGG